LRGGGAEASLSKKNGRQATIGTGARAVLPKRLAITGGESGKTQMV